MPVEIILYTPTRFEKPRVANVPSAWHPNDTILAEIIEKFQIPPHRALEFGVDYGYSASALANYFDEVVGVDHFKSDQHTGYRENLYEQASRALADFPNVRLVCADYCDFIQQADQLPEPPQYDLIHVDMFHDYDCTYMAGRWAADHASIVLFHDTQGWDEVKRAVSDIAQQTGMTFYNYPVSFGLGILTKEKL